MSDSPALPLSHSPTLPLSHSPTLPLSRSPALPLSRSPALPLSRSPALPLSRSPSFLLLLSRLDLFDHGFDLGGVRGVGAVFEILLEGALREIVFLLLVVELAKR